jgi:Uma2 family endonuclease
MTPRMPLTAEELFLIPSDGNKAELVGGMLVRMPATGALHGQVTARIGELLAAHVRQHGLGVVAAAETGFVLHRSPDTVRAPDAAFIARERIPDAGVPEGYWPCAPDLAVEVISPGDRASDVEGKVEDYLAAGTRLVWVIHLRARQVCVYRPQHESCTLSGNDELRGGAVLPGFSCLVRELFA